MAASKRKLSAGTQEIGPLGCLLGQPASFPQHRIREVSKETGISVKKIKSVLSGKPAGLTFLEFQTIRKILDERRDD